MLGDITQLRATMREARAQVNGTAAGMRQAGATAYAGMARMGKSVSLIGVGVGVTSLKMAGDFQAQTMVLHTAAGETLSGLKTVRAGILDIAKDTGTDWHNLTEGMYQIEKAGIRGADGLKVLKAASQGAREENASLESVTNAMTSVMASYHIKAKDSVQVMNGMKTAAGEGKMTMEQFAASLSTVLPIASANKISFSEVSGALATLTQHGTSAREGTQELASTIRNLASPNNVAVQEMQRLGLSSTDVAKGLKDVKDGGRGLTGTFDLLSKTVMHKMGPSGTLLLSSFNKTKQAAHDADMMVKAMPKGIQGLAKSYNSGKLSLADWRQQLKGLPPEQANLLQQYAVLKNKTNGFSAELKRGGPAAQTYTEAMKKMLGGSIGLNTSLQLTGENTDGYRHRVEKIRESYEHVTKNVEGWDQTQKLFNVRLAKAKQAVAVLAIEIGTKLIPIVTSAVDWFSRHKTIATTLAGIFAGVLALSVVAYASKLVFGAGKAVFGLAKVGVAGVKATGRVVQGFRSAQVAQSAFSGKAGSFGGALRKMWNGSISGAKAAGRGVATFGKSVGGLAAKGGRAAWAGVTKGITGAARAMRTASSAALTLGRRMAATTLAAVRSGLAWAAQKIKVIAAAIAARTAAIAQWLLNVAMSANPIVLVVLALAALVIGLVWAYKKVGWFRSFVNGAFQAIASVVTWLVGWVKAHWPLLLAILTGPIGIAVLLIMKYWKKISSGFMSAYHTTVNAGRTLVAWVKGLPASIAHALGSLAARLGTNASNAWRSFKLAMVKAVVAVVTYVQGIPHRTVVALGKLGSLLYSAGRSLITGFVNGIKSMAGGAYDAAHSLVSKIGGLFPHSPAKEGPFSGRGWTLHSGRALMDGLAQGIRAGAPNAVAVMRSAALATSNGFAQTMGIHSPSTVFRSLGIYVNQGLVDGLTASTARVKAATRRIETLFIQTRNRLKDSRTTGKTRGGRNTNAWVAQKLRALSNVERYVKREDGVMKSLAAKRDSTAKKLKDAQKKVADLQKSWTTKRDEIASSIMQGMSVVTESPDEGRSVNSFDIVAKMREQYKAAADFTKNLAALRKKGVRTDLIEQIASAGVAGGGDTARALAAASSGQIKEMNSLQAGMKAKAKSTGTTVADAMYKSGIQAAKGLVKGLQKQEKSIEKQMVSIAKKMAAAIKRALKIKSPSRVFSDIGEFIPQGLAVGIGGEAHRAVAAARKLAAGVTQAGMPTAGGGFQPLPMGGLIGGTVIHQHQHVHMNVEGHVLTERKLIALVQEGTAQVGARNPTTYPAYRR
ncbi:phage tail tape measure protein [Streptomyces sp. NBC_00198]|uniref:phage tail tape measure protein n=1 Tax=Streptomyces sp. NBC_00198 TaxID=2975677 RepID=UPI002259DE9A|nr:phage tail tape measure protein [Streptomyces sp. NBC_00198]MCX5285697.1 phage tail tape measure protein [Streptomyces sp. NBC_00198]MCX5286201.1 phage tail tape measure protein [Streptomyces sp. NBC_00198]